EAVGVAAKMDDPLIGGQDLEDAVGTVLVAGGVQPADESCRRLRPLLLAADLVAQPPGATAPATQPSDDARLGNAGHAVERNQEDGADAQAGRAVPPSVGREPEPGEQELRGAAAEPQRDAVKDGVPEVQRRLQEDPAPLAEPTAVTPSVHDAVPIMPPFSVASIPRGPARHRQASFAR